MVDKESLEEHFNESITKSTAWMKTELNLNRKPRTVV